MGCGVSVGGGDLFVKAFTRLNDAKGTSNTPSLLGRLVASPRLYYSTPRWCHSAPGNIAFQKSDLSARAKKRFEVFRLRNGVKGQDSVAQATFDLLNREPIPLCAPPRRPLSLSWL